MRLTKLLVTLIGIVATGPALAEPAYDSGAATPVAILRGSSAPPAPYMPPLEPKQVEVREVVYVPVYYPLAYYPGLPFAVERRHRHVAATTHRK